MIRSIAFGMVALLAGLAIAADAKDDATKAAKKLGEAANYSWKTTIEMGGNSQFRPGPTEGKTEKDGFTMVTSTFGQNQTTIVYVLKGTKGAVKIEDAWQSAEEAGQAAQGPGRFLARMAQTFKAPAAQAEDIIGKVKALKEADGALAGDLTEEGAKSLMMMGGRGGNNAPEIAGAKGSAKFWVKDGVLTKFQYQVQGKVTFNNNERDVDRTTTVEIKDVGSTKLDVPEEAKKKIG